MTTKPTSIEMTLPKGRKVHSCLVELMQKGFGRISALPTGTGRYFIWIRNDPKAIAIVRKYGGTIARKQPEWLKNR
jgi:hypothetical protein